MPDPDPQPDPIVDPAPDPTPDPKPDPPKDEPLGDGGKAALDKERADRKAEKKRADALQARLDALEADKLSDTEKLQKRADDAESKVTAATEKLRRAHLLTALADKGLAGTKAQAAAKLIDGVDYDDDDQPKNLDDAITAATALYGEDMFKGFKPKAPRLNGGDGGTDDGDKPSLTAEQLDMAKAMNLTPEEYLAYSDPEYRGPPAKKD